MTVEVEAPKAEALDPSKEKGKETAPKDTPTVDVTKTPEFKKLLDQAVGKSTATLNAQVTISKQATQAAEAKTAAIEAAQSKTNSDIEYLERKLEGLATDKFSEDPEAAKGYKNTLALELRERKANARDEAQNLRDAEQARNKLFLQLGEKAREIKGKREIPEGILEICTSVEQMDGISKHFPEISEKKEPDKVEKNEFDSNTSNESGELPDRPTNEQVEALGSMDQYAKWRKKNYK